MTDSGRHVKVTEEDMVPVAFCGCITWPQPHHVDVDDDGKDVYECRRCGATYVGEANAMPPPGTLPWSCLTDGCVQLVPLRPAGELESIVAAYEQQLRKRERDRDAS